MRKLINLFLVIAMAVSFGMISCAENENNLSQTGLFDQNGNLNRHGYIDEYSLGDE